MATACQLGTAVTGHCKLASLQALTPRSAHLRLNSSSIGGSVRSRSRSRCSSCVSVNSALVSEKAKDITDDLNGTCIFLIGMMESMKSSVGKILADSLGYYFFDSDVLVQSAAGGSAEIFDDEESYRDAETEVLRQLSPMGRLVVATGSGSVVRSENWGYLRHGIIVWIDGPLEGSDKKKDLAEVSKLYEARKGAYGHADAVVSMTDESAKLDLQEPSSLTPAMVAAAVLEVIEEKISAKKRMGAVRY